MDSQEHLTSLGKQAERAPPVPSILQGQKVSMGCWCQLCPLQHPHHGGLQLLWSVMLGWHRGFQGQKPPANVSRMRGLCWTWTWGQLITLLFLISLLSEGSLPAAWPMAVQEWDYRQLSCVEGEGGIIMGLSWCNTGWVCI